MARSTLELLLDSIKEREEEPPDHLPALPHRPTSRARLPSRKRTSALLLNTSSKQLHGRMQQTPLHVPDELRLHSNGNNHPEAHLALSNGDGFSHTFQNGYGKETENGDRFTENKARQNTMELLQTQELLSTSSKENRLCDKSGLPDSALLPKKQAPSPAYLSLKKRKRLLHILGLQKDSGVWFLNDENNWVIGIVQAAGDLDAPVVCRADDKLLEIPIEKLLPVNPEFLDRVDDLVQLSYIHEPAVFYVLQRRYELGMFCTRAGSSCIVFTPPKGDPLQSCSHSFEQSPLKDQDSMAVGCKWSPVHAIVDNAHHSLTKDWKDQSIIFGGECSAARTLSVQAVLERLISYGNNDELGKTLSNCNLILETFGNALIGSGVSASRYGKLVDLNFDKGGNICSAHVQLLFLEKSRVVCRAERECSYHIFYQLCEGADNDVREKFNLREAIHFNYLRSNTYVNGAHPCSDFKLLLNAFHVLGFTEKIQQEIFSLLGAILWLGNITSTAINNNEAADNAANLLNCSKRDLLEALGDNEDVSLARDALAGALYERLFKWLVAQINKTLKPKKVPDFKSITIADMQGFGFCKSDGLESLLVNYAQEHLQHFTRSHLLQQGEEIATCGGLRNHTTNSLSEDERIHFLEHELLPLIVSHEGLEESEPGFMRSAEKLLAGNPCCKQSHSKTFTVTHASGEATYNLDTFLKEMKAFSYTRSSQILQLCMDKLLEMGATNKNAYSQESFSEGFSMQQHGFLSGQERVLEMMQQLEDTEPHFIFCMARSESKFSQTLEQGYVVRQLRINEIIEAVTLCRSGYLVNYSHGLFAIRFGPLITPDIKKMRGSLAITAAVLHRLQVPSYMYQMGWTRIFLCSEQADRLEYARKQFLNNLISIQKTFRGFRIRKQLERQKLAVTHLQAFVRGWLVRKGFSRECETKVEIGNSVLQYMARTNLALEPSQDSLEDRNHLVKEGADGSSSTGHLADMQQDEYLPKERGDIMQVKSSHGYKERLQTMDSELALKKKEEEISLLQQSVKEYERKWMAYEAKMKSMEEMWQKQVTSLEQRLSVATKGSNTEESAYKTGDSDKAVLISTPPHYASARDTPETTSGEPDGVARNELDPSRSALDHLGKELEHRTQVFNDDARFLVEVKSGQIAANFKPDEELQKLRQRFEVWKKDYKGRLKETKGRDGGVGNKAIPRVFTAQSNRSEVGLEGGNIVKLTGLVIEDVSSRWQWQRKCGNDDWSFSVNLICSGAKGLAYGDGLPGGSGWVYNEGSLY
ncbi:hypothetical protein GOP47_0006108 [Adiantum capillus-veneris]|uniref:Myosin motor domain-containing protein n=1 Tax=Adiantum capillus-veneris TaxID=13818 RepID=A0A9D4V342_ADICA|nr:hypothetical protein GOP47_0006108 [Adiantum capillus-veneris]